MWFATLDQIKQHLKQSLPGKLVLDSSALAVGRGRGYFIWSRKELDGVIRILPLLFYSEWDLTWIGVGSLTCLTVWCYTGVFRKIDAKLFSDCSPNNYFVCWNQAFTRVSCSKGRGWWSLTFCFLIVWATLTFLILSLSLSENAKLVQCKWIPHPPLDYMQN